MQKKLNAIFYSPVQDIVGDAVLDIQLSGLPRGVS